MALNLISVLKMLGNSSSVANTVTSLIKEVKKIRDSGKTDDDLKQALELQSQINEKLETQIKLLGDSITALQKSIKNLFVIVIIAVILIAAVAAFVLVR